MKISLTTALLCVALIALPCVASAQDDTLAPVHPPAATAGADGATAAPATDPSSAIPDDLREKLKNAKNEMTPAQQEQVKEQIRKKFQDMTPEEKEQLKEKMQEQLKAHLQDLTPDQKAKLKDIIQNKEQDVGGQDSPLREKLMQHLHQNDGSQ